ncbi:hypothetical protein LOTGIDRAFT_225295 [Lottia gigantea]|uniref:Methionine synthase reductase n=1 Tax=Lottia gigantea TaxID=225164 RepID=V4AW26_LOTGI|nr:hypothetical protein LOTGIDRAFT_225295 [Lottia gigantea]ESP01628.1 hypothetical protein LOTGIDRAFT_225295 [Lottia gigantea]
MPVIVKNRFLLLYGSQTGQAKAIAEEIADRCVEQGLHADVICLSQTEKKFNIERESSAVFILSTTGEGDPPDTAAKFVRRLKKKTLPDGYLSQLNFTILGLGDTNYTNFCNCPKGLNQRLLELGAHHFYPPGWADDAVGLEVVVEPWIDNLWEPLKKHQMNGFGGETTVTIDKTNISESIMDSGSDTSVIKPVELNTNMNSNGNVIVEIDNSDIGVNQTVTVASLTESIPPLSTIGLNLPTLPPPYIHLQYNTDNILFPSAASEIKSVPITSATVLTSPDAVKKTLKLSIGIQDSKITYEPGDSISVICPNSTEEVDSILKRLDISDEADCEVNLSIIPETTKRKPTIPLYIPESCTLRYIFTTCIDIREPPKKALLRAFVEYTDNPTEKRRLQELCSKQGASDYAQFIREKNLSILDILTAFQSCHPAVSSLIEHTSRLKPRPYSACSAPCINKNSLSFVFNVIEIPEGEGRCCGRQGVCTGWLDKLTESIQRSYNKQSLETELESLSLSSSIQIPIYCRNNQHFRPPTDLSRRVVFIGPGTGVAPFIGFLAHRQHQRQLVDKDTTYGDTWLFYGCRHPNKDFLFEEELERYKETGVLTKLCVSVSRDPDVLDKPKYVQDYILQEINSIYDILIDDTSLIYVCGDAKNMAKNVNEVFMKILKIKKGMTDDEAKAFIMTMRLHKRYFEDVWT